MQLILVSRYVPRLVDSVSFLAMHILNWTYNIEKMNMGSKNTCFLFHPYRKSLAPSASPVFLSPVNISSIVSSCSLC